MESELASSLQWIGKRSQVAHPLCGWDFKHCSSVVAVQLLSCIWLCHPIDTAHQASLSFTISWNLLKLMSIESVMPSNNLILCHHLLLLPSIFPSVGVFSNESGHCIRWPKYWSFSFSISPSSEYSGLISFSIDWFYLFAVQGTLNSLLQHTVQSINSSVCTLLYGLTLISIHDFWKNQSFDYTFWAFWYTVCHNSPSRKQLSFNFVVGVNICSDFGAPQSKVCHCFHCFPIYFPWSDGTGCHDLHLSFKPAL